MLKRDFSERNTGQGPAVKRRDSTGAQGRLVYSFFLLCFEVNAGLCCRCSAIYM